MIVRFVITGMVLVLAMHAAHDGDVAWAVTLSALFLGCVVENTAERFTGDGS